MKYCKDHPKQNPYEEKQSDCYTCAWNRMSAKHQVEMFIVEGKCLFGVSGWTFESAMKNFAKSWKTNHKWQHLRNSKNST